MSPVGRPHRGITSSQASMQAVQLTHSSWMPLRMSMPVGQTVTQRWQSTQSPVVAAPVACARGAARLAATAS